jgi:hypothetical protein
MAKNTSNNIKIHFRAEGEQELTNAIKVLSAATTQLKNSQMQLAQSMGMTDKERKKAIASGQLALRNQRNINQAVQQGNMTFSVFRSKLLLASFALGLVGGTVGRLVQAFAEQEESERRVQAALESTGNAAGLTAQEIFEMTSRLQEVGVVGDEVNNKLASFILTFTNIRGEAFERTLVAANNMAISISGTVPGFEQLRGAATMLSKALQDPKSQLGALSRAGFTFTDSQKAMVKELAENGKIMEAQNIILDAADVQYGKLAEQLRGTTTGAFQALGMATGDAAETFGEVLAPATVAVMDSMTSLMTAIKENKTTIEALINTGKFLAPVLLVVGGQASLLARGLGYLGRVGGTLVRFFGSAKGALATMAGFGLFAVEKKAADAREELEKLNETVDGSSKVYTPEELKALGKLSDAMDKRILQTRESNEDRQLQADITKATTEEEFKAALQAKKEILIKRELSKIDKSLHEDMKGQVETLVDLTLEQDKNNFSTKQRTKAIKEALEAQKQMDSILRKAVNYELDAETTLAELAAMKRVTTREEFDAEEKRIEQLKTFSKVARALGVDSFDLATAIKEGQTLATITYDETNAAVLGTLESVKLMINAQGQLVALSDSFGEKSVSAFEKFKEGADVAMQSLSGFSQAQTQLVEERMQREMEALKASRDYEEASQEQREVMENRIEQKFKSQRKKAFMISKASNMADAAMNTAEAYTKALPNIPLATLVAALGAAQVAAIAAQPAPRFATGGSFITTGPTQMLVGESGAERVTVQPLGGKNARQTSGSVQNININVSAPLVDETILDVIIPKIEEAGKLNIA